MWLLDETRLPLSFSLVYKVYFLSLESVRFCYNGILYGRSLAHSAILCSDRSGDSQLLKSWSQNLKKVRLLFIIVSYQYIYIRHCGTNSSESILYWSSHLMKTRNESGKNDNFLTIILRKMSCITQISPFWVPEVKWAKSRVKKNYFIYPLPANGSAAFRQPNSNILNCI